MNKPKRHPFWEGQYAHEDGLGEYDNPYPPNTYEHAAWHHGWAAAEQERPANLQDLLGDLVDGE